VVKSAPAIDALNALSQWAPIAALKANAIGYPLLEVIHIVAIALVFGTLWIVDLRILGRMQALPLQRLASYVLPWTLFGFTLAAITGLLMFAMRAGDLIANTAFLLKIVLLFAAGTNAAILHSRGPIDEQSGATRFQALLSIAIWVCVIAAGRWIAYV
jgi:hypothetical protein